MSLPYDTPGVATGGTTPTAPIDVVIPVYGAAEEFKRCLASVRRHADAARERLIIVLDGPGQSEAEAAIASDKGPITVLHHAERRGFVAAVQTGIAASGGDVILLNSDTVVTARWVQKLQEAAYSAPWIATVTPFSNDATLCSLPRAFESNALPTGHDVDSFARVVETCTTRAYPRIPTGVGVCLYIKRAVLDSVGGFDSGHFGLGYGEEVEFCFRALKAGWRHVLDDATFIYHAGQRSFGTLRRRRVRSAERMMARLHPEYRATIGRFMREDPIAPLRAAVVSQLATKAPQTSASPTRRILHVAHGWPPWNSAGTEVYARGLVVRQASQSEVAVYARIADPCRSLGDATELLDRGARVRLVVNNFMQRDPLSRNALRNRTLEADFARFVEQSRPDLAHVHHLAGHSAGLIRVLRRRGIPYIFQLQDWWMACARANLLRPDGSLCAGPELRKCSECLPLTALPLHAIWNPLLYAARRRALASAVRHAAVVVTGSRFMEASAREMGILAPGQECRVLAYGVEAPGQALPRPPAPPPIRFGVVGSIMPHKGIHVAVGAFSDVDPAAATLDVWGNSSSLPAYADEIRRAAGPAVRFRGVFDESAKNDVFAGMHVLVVPSLGLESFGLAAREAMACGVPVLASRRGALPESFEDGRQGAFFNPDDPIALRGCIDRLLSRPDVIDEWARHLPAVKTVDEHAAEIEAIYEDVLRSVRRG